MCFANVKIPRKKKKDFDHSAEQEQLHMHNKEIVLGVERVCMPKKMTTQTFCSNLMYWSMMFRQFSTIKINIKIMHVA